MELSILKRASLPPSQATAREVTRPTQMKAGVQGGFSGQDARPQIENANPSTGTAELSVFRLAPSEGGNLLNPEDETTDYHLYQALTEAAKEMELDWPDPFDWKRIKTRIIEIAFGCLVFAAPVGFSIACWQGLGYACEIIFSRSGSFR